MKAEWLFSFMFFLVQLLVLFITGAVFTLCVLEYYYHDWFQAIAATMLFLLIFFVTTFTTVSWTTVPTIFWRWRKNVQVRIIELVHENNRVYAVQLKCLGMWYYVRMCKEVSQMQTTLSVDWAGQTFVISDKYKAEKLLVELEKYIAETRTTKHLIEVLDRYTISDGQKLKTKFQ